MVYMESLNETAINALFATKRADDINTFGSKTDTARNNTDIAAQGVTLATQGNAITALQTSVASLNTTLNQTKKTTCTSGTRPASPALYQAIYETDTKAEGFWDGNGWVMKDTVERAYTPILTSAGAGVTLGTGNTRSGRYRRNGEFLHYYGTIYTGTTGFVGGLNTLRVSLPYKVKTATITKFGIAMLNARGNDHAGISRVDSAGTWLIMLADYLDTNSAPNRLQTANVANTDGSGNPGTGVPRFLGNYTWDSNNPGYLNWDITYPFDPTSPGA